MRSTTLRGYACVLEVAPADAGFIHCLASADALAGLRIDGVLISPIAPGETLLLSSPNDTAAILAAATAALSADPHALVLDLGDAYDGVRLSGDISAAFARLADWPLLNRPSIQQGLFAELAAKIVHDHKDLYVFVGSHVGHHLKRRLHQACAKFGIRDVDPVAFRPQAASR